MKKIILILTIITLAFQGHTQELPENFKETVREDYYNIPAETRVNELGLSFEDYLDSRIKAYLNKQKFYTSISQLRSVNNLCDNGTFENGNIDIGDWNFEWGGGTFPSSGVAYTTTVGYNMVDGGSFNGTGNSHSNEQHHRAVSLSSDPTVPIINTVWNFPTGNTTSVRLGNKGWGYGYESISKIINVTSSNYLLRFSYAMVVENPGHGINSDPSFRVNLIDADNPTINYNALVNLGGNGANYISSSHPLLKSYNRIQYKDWSCVTVDLSPLIGKRIIIEFENKDCGAGGHWGYSYVDNICLSCEGANGDEGSIQINQGQSSDCGFPGQICVDYTLPNGNNPQLNLELQLIQNGSVISTLASPSLISGTSYCFNLATSNTGGLNSSLGGFDYKILGQPSLNGFNLTPKIIGNSADGVTGGTNNDYDFNCPPNFNCCETDLAIWNYYGTPDPLPIQQETINGVNYSYAEETLEIHNDASIPITELRVNVTDIEFEYTYDQCADCINNSALWGSIHSTDNTIGTAPNSLNQTPAFTQASYENSISNGVNQREVIWENGNGALLKNGDTFSVRYILPPVSQIPCCATRVKICSKISWKDANCKVCEVNTCSNIDLSNNPGGTPPTELNDCCDPFTGFTIDDSYQRGIFFSPNGDLMNDYFFIPDFEENKDCAYNAQGYELKIFNRWGSVVYEKKVNHDKCCPFKLPNSSSDIKNNPDPNTYMYWDGVANKTTFHVTKFLFWDKTIYESHKGEGVPSGSYWATFKLFSCDGKEVYKSPKEILIQLQR